MTGPVYFPCALQNSMEDVYLGLLRCRFEDLLRALTLERADIREAMVFALDNADCAAEVWGCPRCP